MTMTAGDIQTALDNDGYVFIEKGTHTISTQIILDGQSRMKVEGHPQSSIVWNGTAGAAPFLYRMGALAQTFPLEFKMVTVDCSGVPGTPCWSTEDITDRPHYLLFEDCDFTADEHYCINIKAGPYLITPVFRRMRTAGSGAIRFRSRTGGSDPYWLTSQCLIEQWYHDGDKRVGPAFDFRGVGGLRMFDIYDTGKTDLLESLRGVYEGPLSVRMNSVRTPAYIQNYRFRYTNDYTNAANCFPVELRTDNANGTGKQEYVRWIGSDIADSNATPASFRVMGGNTSTMHVLVVDLVDCEDVDKDELLIGGKAWVRVERSWVNPGNESIASASETYFDGVYSGSWRDPIYTDTDRAPSNANDGGEVYSGSQRATDYQAVESDFEDLL